jgi:hypothetical protein
MDLYRVEAPNSEEYAFPVSLTEALNQLKKRAPRERFGNALRVIRVRYQLDPAHPPTVHTAAMRQVWRATVVRFPDIGSLGVCVCKESSQHRYGHAADWAASREAKDSGKLRAYLKRIADWQVKQAEAGDLPISQVIYRSRIWQPGGWKPYTGVPHIIHVHTSCSPLMDTSKPCTC